MEKNEIKYLVFTALFFVTTLLVSFTLEDQADNHYSRNTIISDIDQTIANSLVNNKNYDNIIIHGKFVGMFEAEFNQNSTKIIIEETDRSTD
ncbi:MAG: hypothetical protein OQJ81_12355 [Melioribacteraceae bacterium]|nr:hypothetical protein [Melioribacteraceae bacterium]